MKLCPAPRSHSCGSRGVCEDLRWTSILDTSRSLIPLCAAIHAWYSPYMLGTPPCIPPCCNPSQCGCAVFLCLLFYFNGGGGSRCVASSDADLRVLTGACCLCPMMWPADGTRAGSCVRARYRDGRGNNRGQPDLCRDGVRGRDCRGVGPTVSDAPRPTTLPSGTRDSLSLFARVILLAVSITQ